MGKRFPLTVMIIGLLAAGQPCGSVADEPLQSSFEQEKARLNREQVDKGVGDVDVLKDGETEPLKPEIVLRWVNPVRVTTGAGAIAVWAREGRPEAMAGVFIWNGDLCHELCSLSREGKLTAKPKTGPRRSMIEPGVEFKVIPDAPAPADTPAARLRQMKSLAERFTARLADKAGANQQKEELRLLPKPLYRYEIKDPATNPAKLVDGALFAYVMGTDPEVVLLLEAVGQDKPAWQYGFAIATTHAVEASLGEQIVWSRRGFGLDTQSAEVFLRKPLAE